MLRYAASKNSGKLNFEKSKVLFNTIIYVWVHRNLEAVLPINVVAKVVEYCVILSGRGLQANFPFPLVPQQHERAPRSSRCCLHGATRGSPLLVVAFTRHIIFVVNSIPYPLPRCGAPTVLLCRGRNSYESAW